MNWSLRYPIAKCKQTKVNTCALMSVLSWVTGLASLYVTCLTYSSDGFRSRLGTSCVSSHAEELWYKETISHLMTIYITNNKKTRRQKYLTLLVARLIILGIHTSHQLQNTLWIFVTVLKSLMRTFALYWVSHTLHFIW